MVDPYPFIVLLMVFLVGMKVKACVLVSHLYLEVFTFKRYEIILWKDHLGSEAVEIAFCGILHGALADLCLSSIVRLPDIRVIKVVFP